MILSKKNIFFYFIIFFAFSVPIFNAQLKSFGNILINGLLILFLFPILLIKKNAISTELKRNKTLANIIILYILYFLLVLISLYIGSFHHFEKIILRDFYEFHKPILYILIILFIYSLYYKNINLINFSKILYLIFTILLVFAYFQLNHFRYFSLMYIDLGIYNSNRLTAPFGNPYDYAFVMIFFCFFFFYKYIFQKKIFVIPFVISVWMLFETGSKSNAFGFFSIFIFIIPIIILFSKINFNKRIFYFFHILIIPILFFNFNYFQILIDNYPNIFDQFSQFFNQGNIGESGEVRLDQFFLSLKRAFDYPLLLLFGNGPSKGLEIGYYTSGDIFYSEHLESALTYLFFRYGLMGLLLFFSIYLYLIKIMIVNNKHLKNFSDIKLINLSILTWFLSIPFVSIGGMYMEQPRASFFFYSLIGITLIINRNIKFQ